MPSWGKSKYSISVWDEQDYFPIYVHKSQLINPNTQITVFVGPCHHGMARLQVADGGTASDMEGSGE